MTVIANKFRIPPTLLAQCFAHGRETYPHEACGVLSGPADSPAAVSQAHRIVNILDVLHCRDPKHYPRTARKGYVLDPYGYLKVERALEAKGHRIKAVYHTHIDVGAYFSPEDRRHALWVYALAQVLTLWYMLITNTVHPPAGANPLIMIYGQSSLSALWQPIFVGVLSLAVVAAAWSRLYPGLSHYPVAWLDRSPPTTFWGGWGE